MSISYIDTIFLSLQIWTNQWICWRLCLPDPWLTGLVRSLLWPDMAAVGLWTPGETRWTILGCHREFWIFFWIRQWSLHSAEVERRWVADDCRHNTSIIVMLRWACWILKFYPSLYLFWHNFLPISILISLKKVRVCLIWFLLKTTTPNLCKFGTSNCGKTHQLIYLKIRLSKGKDIRINCHKRSTFPHPPLNFISLWKWLWWHNMPLQCTPAFQSLKVREKFSS